MSWKVRLPMMCRLAFLMVSTAWVVASGSLSNTHSIPSSGPPTKPSTDVDVFKIRCRFRSQCGSGRNERSFIGFNWDWILSVVSFETENQVAER
jgi:hypothetical protein